MFCLMTHSTFYLQLYGARDMVNDHSYSERGNLLPPHRLFFPISSKGSFICTSSHDSTYHSLCYTNRGALAEFTLIVTDIRHISLRKYHTESLTKITSDQMYLNMVRIFRYGNCRKCLWSTQTGKRLRSRGR